MRVTLKKAIEAKTQIAESLIDRLLTNLREYIHMTRVIELGMTDH